MVEYLALHCVFLRKQHLAGTESIPFNEIFEFVENLLFVLF